jgi:hypothetical protein
MPHFSLGGEYMTTCFGCFEPKSGHLPACRRCAEIYSEAYGPQWYARPEVQTLINYHRRMEYQQEQLSRLLASGEYELRLTVRTVDDDIVDLLHKGTSTKEIVARLKGDAPGRSQAQLYRRVRKAREQTGLWAGATRR